MKRVVVVVVVLVVVVLGGLGAWLALGGAGEGARPEPVAIGFGDLGQPYPAATIQGTAHYSVVIEQTVPATLLAEEQHFWLYGLFPEHDTSGREIRMLVRSPVAPEDMVSFEYVRLTGPIAKPNRYTVPPNTEEYLYRQSDYFFAGELWVMEPWSTESYEPSAREPEDTDVPDPDGDTDGS